MAEVRGWPRRVLLVLVVAGAAGGATSLLQTVLPHAVASFANSAGSWCLLAWLLARPSSSAVQGAAAAVLALVALVAGYYVVADLRGGFGVSAASVTAWLVAAATVGPVLGAGAAWSRVDRGWRRVLGALVLPGLLVAEAAYGVALLRASTSTGYWVAEGLVGLLLALALVGRRTTARVRRRVAALFADSDNRLTPEHVG